MIAVGLFGLLGYIVAEHLGYSDIQLQLSIYAGFMFGMYIDLRNRIESCHR